jgi:membrane protein implicated in regulation of membrane protease activity
MHFLVHNNRRRGFMLSTAFFLWLIVGALLIVGELMTGTFYLLLFGIAAWAGAVAAYFGVGVDFQLAVSGATALLAWVVVQRWGRHWRGDAVDNVDTDVGNEIRVEQVDGARLKVQYRGTLWTAEPEDGAVLTAGQVGVIRAIRGNLLIVGPLKRA